MCRELLWKILSIAFSSILTYQVTAQTPSVTLSGASGAQGDQITLTMNLSSNGATRPAAVQWDLNYSVSDLTPSVGVFFSNGAAASAAGKAAACSVPAPGSIRCIVSGFNKTVISDGTLVLLTFKIAATRSSPTTLSLVRVLGADRTGGALTMNGSSVNVAITQAGMSSKINCVIAGVMSVGFCCSGSFREKAGFASQEITRWLGC